MLDQLIIGNKASNDDFGASIKTRKIKDPKKKKITKTVPFSNALYDFTKLNGEIYWEWRELEYVFEMIAPTPEELEEMKAEFSNFIMNVVEENIYDPFIPDYHFIATYEDKSYDDDESGLKTTMTVIFLAYPYKVANAEKKKSVALDPFKATVIHLYNNSSHRIAPTIEVVGTANIVLKDKSYTISNNTLKDNLIMLDIGENAIGITNRTTDEPLTVTFSFREEIF